MTTMNAIDNAKLFGFQAPAKEEKPATDKKHDFVSPFGFDYHRETFYFEATGCDAYISGGNAHFKTTKKNNERNEVGYDTVAEAMAVVKFLATNGIGLGKMGICHISYDRKDGKYYVVPTYAPDKK